MKKCRVLELIGGSLTDGGAETLVKDYVLNIDKDRFETAIFVDWTIGETANTRILTDSGQLIFTAYPIYSLFWRVINRYFRRTYMVRGIRKEIKEFNPDVIHIHLDALSYLPELDSVLKGRRLFYTCHSTVEAMFGDNPVEAEAAKELIGKLGLRLVALHQKMADELNQFFNVSNTIVINNGIDISRFRNVKESRESIRLSLGIPEKAFVIGHVGRFSEVKNHNLIVEIFRKVKEKQENAFLLLVGDGELKAEIERKIKEAGLDSSSLILSNRTDIPRILKAMDIFLFPSIFEGLGIALVEAQAAGLRCVVSNNVPDSACVSNLVCSKSLSDSVESWSEAVLDTNRRGPYKNGLEEYDIRLSVSKLEKLYLGEI